MVPRGFHGLIDSLRRTSACDPTAGWAWQELQQESKKWTKQEWKGLQRSEGTRIYQCGSGTEPRTAKRTGIIGTEPEPFIFTNRTGPVGNWTVWSANRKHEPVANRLRTAGICLFSIHSSTSFFAWVRPAMFLATFACAKISLAAFGCWREKTGKRREERDRKEYRSRYFRLRTA